VTAKEEMRTQLWTGAALQWSHKC